MNYKNYKKDVATTAGAIVIAILLLIAICFIGPVIVMWLWNWVAVALLAVPVINYWQAFGIMWLCHILFGRCVTVKRD